MTGPGRALDGCRATRRPPVGHRVYYWPSTAGLREALVCDLEGARTVGEAWRINAALAVLDAAERSS